VAGALALMLRVSLDGPLTAMLALVLMVSVFVMAVQGVYQGISGATPGKLVFKIRLVDKSGQPPGPPTALIRTAIGIVDIGFGLAPVGLVLAHFSREQRRIGDMVAGTWVVHAGRLGEPPVPDGSTAEIGQFITPDMGTFPLPRADVHQVPAVARPLPSPPPTGVPSTPKWDPDRQCYIQWDNAGARWMHYIEGLQRWVPLDQ